jgi:hypothetical protein
MNVLMCGKFGIVAGATIAIKIEARLIELLG